MYSYVCVLSTDNYLDGVLVLNENLKQLKSKYPLLCLINENISEDTRSILTKFNIKYKVCNALLPTNMSDRRWKYTFDKLNIFNLTEYEKIVYLDSDFLILDNLDHLFNIERFSMVKDCKKDFYCSALMVVMPNMKDYFGLIDLFNKNERDGIGDQDLINEYFDDINVIPVEYNFIKGISEEEIEVFDHIKNKKVLKNKCKDYYRSNNPVIIHYYGDTKPWMIDKEFDDKYCYLYFYYLDIIRNKKES